MVKITAEWKEIIPSPTFFIDHARYFMYVRHLFSTFNKESITLQMIMNLKILPNIVGNYRNHF
jgi:hypothetical protein